MRDDQLDRRLRRTDPMAGVHVPEHVLDRMHVEVRAASAKSRQRRFAGIAGLGVFALGGLTAAPVAADAVREWLAVAEWQPEAGGEILPDSEMVDLSATDLPEYIAAKYPDWLPIPPGSTREQLIAQVVERWSQVPEVGFTQEVGIRETFERIAYCGWVDAWLTAGDPAVVAEATGVMADAPEWPAINQTDGGGVVAVLAVFAEAARTGDHDGVQYAAWQWGCSAWDGDPREWWGQENGPTW
jgi:hypothetical protein